MKISPKAKSAYLEAYFEMEAEKSEKIEEISESDEIMFETWAWEIDEMHEDEMEEEARMYENEMDIHYREEMDWDIDMREFDLFY